MFEIIIKEDGKIIDTIGADDHVEVSMSCEPEEIPGYGYSRQFQAGREIITTITCRRPNPRYERPKLDRKPIDSIAAVTASATSTRLNDPTQWIVRTGPPREIGEITYREITAEMQVMCPDCKNTRQYQPLIGPAEPCKTCCGGAT